MLSTFALAFAAEAVSATSPQGPASQGRKESEESRQQEAEETKRLTELYLRSQNVFIRKGELMVELNTFHDRNSRQDLVPVNGGLALVRETRRFFDTTVLARYGILTDGLELDLIAPVFVHAEQESDFGVTRTSTKKEGVGDLGGALPAIKSGTSRDSGPALCWMSRASPGQAARA